MSFQCCRISPIDFWSHIRKFSSILSNISSIWSCKPVFNSFSELGLLSCTRDQQKECVVSTRYYHCLYDQRFHKSFWMVFRGRSRDTSKYNFYLGILEITLYKSKLWSMEELNSVIQDHLNDIISRNLAFINNMFQ